MLPEYALAAALATSCGDPYVLAEVAFTFVVEQDGVEVVRRRHHWKPLEGTVTVTTSQGVVHLEQIHPYIASESPPDDALAAYKSFVNDSYWLLFPCKVLDPGVELAMDGERLALSFTDGTGVTSGDRYWLTVEGDRVAAWDYVLESGGEGRFTFDEPTRYGPLVLSTRATGENTVVRFEEVLAR